VSCFDASTVFPFMSQYLAQCFRSISSRLLYFHVAARHFTSYCFAPSNFLQRAVTPPLNFGVALLRLVRLVPLHPRAAIICLAPALCLPRSSLSLIQFILLRSDSPSAFPAIYFTLLHSNFMPLHSAPLCIARYPGRFSSSLPLLRLPLHYFASLHYPSH